MIKNRKKVEDFILNFLKEVEPTLFNYNIYKELFSKMSDKDFHNYITEMKEGRRYLVLFKPAYEANGITVENNLKVAEKYGLSFFEHLIFTNFEDDTPSYKTPIKYLVIDLPVRRQSQNLVKKINIPENNKVIDELTFQPTGESKGAKISYPELQVLLGMGLEETLNELMRFRGGDKNGFNVYNRMFMRYGSANLRTLENYATGVESSKTLKSYLLAMHIKVTM